MGDVAYEPNVNDVSTNKEHEKNLDAVTERSTNSDRMCLHAHKLSLPLQDGKRETFLAPDPFTELG